MHLNELIQRRLTRRNALGLIGAGLSMPWGGLAYGRFGSISSPAYQHQSPPPQRPHEQLVLEPGYRATRLISWGDDLRTGESPTFPMFSVEQQRYAFGYNNDYIAYHPLPLKGSRSGAERRALLSVNHEYTCPSLMFPDVKGDKRAPMSPAQMQIEMASVGHSVIEVERSQQGRWRVVWGSPFHRRLSALGPEIHLSGPAAGHRRMRTTQDPTGRSVIGTFSNCAGGQTPWGTTLIAEENVNQHFIGDLERAGAERANLTRFGYTPKHRRSSWHKLDARFDFNQEPHEPNRYGWIVELDPHRPEVAPVKRTSLGRFKHECATCVLAPSGHVVVYSADDHVDEFLYRFISKETYKPEDRALNWGLLDEGTLQVAQLNEQGQLKWLSLTFGEGPLTPDQGFQDQGDVLIETRRAATLLGATPLDRPEGIAVDQERGFVYVMLTQHKDRATAHPWSPRTPNTYGHALTLSLTGQDLSASTGTWSVLFLGGPPQEGGTWPSPGWIKNPDNAAIGPRGDLWIAADSHAKESPSFGNGLWRCALHGERAGIAERFCTVPAGAEPCGISFSDHGRALFFCVQHPGEGSSWDQPSTRWPDFRSDRPPRPSLVVVEREDGGLI